MALVSRAIAHF